MVLSLLRDGLPDDLADLVGLEIEVPLARWEGVVRQVRLDRKLLGGVLLGFSREQDKLPLAIASDRLFGELQRVLIETTLALVEGGELRVAPPSAGDGG